MSVALLRRGVPPRKYTYKLSESSVLSQSLRYSSDPPSVSFIYISYVYIICIALAPHPCSTAVEAICNDSRSCVMHKSSLKSLWCLYFRGSVNDQSKTQRHWRKILDLNGAGVKMNPQTCSLHKAPSSLA